MRRPLLATLALGAFASIALAELATQIPAPTGPMSLTDSQTDRVTVGQPDGPVTVPSNASRRMPPDGFVEALAAVSAEDLLAALRAPPPSPPRPERTRAQTTPAPALEAHAATLPESVDLAKLVVGVQRQLIRLGYAPGPVDGLPGPRTRAAIRAFQRDAGLTVDGEPSAALLARLGGAGSGPEGPTARARVAWPGRTGASAGRAGSLQEPLAITSDDELTAIVARGEHGRR
jgi:putative peptidoglycan binding protein